ncbi:helix-turn-helix domain-containing protein [Sulfitobacter sp.]
MNNQVSTLREKRQQGTLIKDLMAHYGLSKATIYRYLGTKDD